MKICVYAFATTAHFFTRLIEESQACGHGIDWSAVLPRWHHREAFEQLLSPEKVAYLYDRFDSVHERLAGAEPAFGRAADADNELICMLKDKAGYRLLDGDEQLRRAATIVAIYREFLERERPDYMLFPDLEVVDGFLLYSLCKSLGIVPIYYVGMRTLGGGFFSADCYEQLPAYFGDHDAQDLEKAARFLKSFLEGKPEALDEPQAAGSLSIQTAPLWRRALKALFMHIRYERKYAGEDNFLLRLKANFSTRIAHFRAWRFRTFQLRWFHLRDEDAALPKKYVFYALQYTPESSINGLEPYYVDQTRSIDLLLSGLPSDHRLVVKEHPACIGVRPTAFYRELRRKPGLILAAPAIPARRCLEGAALVASVTGTVGLESFMLGRPCLLLGRNFFSHLCGEGEGPGSIRAVIQSLIGRFQKPDPDRQRIELARLIHIRYPILLSDPLVTPAVISPANIKAFLDAVSDHIRRLGSVGSNRDAD